MSDFSFLFDLEKELHDINIRADVKRIDELLASGFFEFGSSGKVWTREITLQKLPQEKGSVVIQSEDYKAFPMADDVVLVTYVTKINSPAGYKEGLRSSIWRKNPGGWQMEFHQGTPRTG